MAFDLDHCYDSDYECDIELEQDHAHPDTYYWDGGETGCITNGVTRVYLSMWDYNTKERMGQVVFFPGTGRCIQFCYTPWAPDTITRRWEQEVPFSQVTLEDRVLISKFVCPD